MLISNHETRYKIPTETLRELNERAIGPWLKDALIDWSIIIGTLFLPAI